MANVAIYLRLSDEDRDKKFKTDESESIQNQKSMLREYCIERHWDIYDIYCDEDYSGIDKNRPEFNRMLKDCEQGKIDIVLCKSQSRFSRDMEIIERYIHNKFLEWNVRFISVVDHADSNDISNKKARQINGLINEWYLEDASENIRKTLKHKREQGEFTGSFAPYGYLVDPENKNHLIVDKKTAPVVRDIFDWYLQGWGYRKIVMELNNRHIPNPSEYKRQIKSKYVNKNEENSYSSGLWTHSTIYTIIRNETYTGSLIQGKSHNVSYKNKKRKPVPEEDWIKVENTHEPIITRDVWIKTQCRLKSRSRTSKITMELSPLAGKVKCAVCKKGMKRHTYYNKSRTIRYYGLQCATYKTGAMNCPNKAGISGIKLETAILSQINQYIEQYCQMDDIQIHQRQESTLNVLKDTLQTYYAKIEGLETKLLKLYDDKLEGLISKEQYVLFSKKYTDEAAEFKQKCDSLKIDIEKIEGCIDSKLGKKDLLKKYSHITKLTKNIVDEFIECVYVGEKDKNGNRDITIHWNF